jgi:hypothetical protein
MKTNRISYGHWLLILVFSIVACCSKEGPQKRLLSEVDVRSFAYAIHYPSSVAGRVFHCDSTTPTTTCFLPAEERKEMLSMGRYTLANVGFDFLSVCRANEELLQTAYKHESQFAAMLAEIAVGPTQLVSSVDAAARAAFETTFKANLQHKAPLLDAIKAASFKVFPQISSSLSILDDEALFRTTGAMLNLHDAEYTALLFDKFK